MDDNFFKYAKPNLSHKVKRLGFELFRGGAWEDFGHERPRHVNRTPDHSFGVRIAFGIRFRSSLDRWFFSVRTLNL